MVKILWVRLNSTLVTSSSIPVVSCKEICSNSYNYISTSFAGGTCALILQYEFCERGLCGAHGSHSRHSVRLVQSNIDFLRVMSTP